MIAALPTMRINDTLNWIFWILLVIVASLVSLRVRRNARPVGPFTACFIALPALVVTLVALRIAYVAPLAIIQDFVAAHQALEGKPLPGLSIGPLVGQVLAEEPSPRSLDKLWPWLARTWPGLLRQEQAEFEKIGNLIKEQAHPPFATLFVIPFFWLLGVHGGSLAFSILSVVCLGATLAILYRELQLRLCGWTHTAIFAALLAWYPMYVVMSHGQWGALLGLLAVIAWYGLRRNCPVLSGFSVGLATSLKVFPGLLLIYFLLRHRRAFWAGVATIVVVNVATACLFGVNAYVDFLRTARAVAGAYGQTRQNWSLFTTLHRVGELVGVPALSSRVAFLGAAFLLVSAVSFHILVTPPSVRQIDVECSLFIVMMTWISPTCWSHYFVLLILPLGTLAVRAASQRPMMLVLLLVLFLTLGVPDFFTLDVRPFVSRHLGIRAGVLVHLLPSFALAGLLAWLSAPAWMESKLRNESAALTGRLSSGVT